MPLLEIHYQKNTESAFLFSVLDATKVCSFHPFPYAPSLPLKRKKWLVMWQCVLTMMFCYFLTSSFFPPVKSYHYGIAQLDPWWPLFQIRVVPSSFKSLWSAFHWEYTHTFEFLHVIWLLVYAKCLSMFLISATAEVRWTSPQWNTYCW